MTMNDTLFQALDANNNGYLTPKEWEGIFYMWNYPEFETIAVEAFKAADKSKDGKISPEEFQQFGVSLSLSILAHNIQFIFIFINTKIMPKQGVHNSNC